MLVGLLAVPPLLASATTGLRATAIVAGYSVLLAAALGVSGGHSLTLDHVLIGIASLIAIWNAAQRQALVASARGGAVVAEGMSLIDDILEEQATVEHLAELTVPELADVCLVDLVREDGAIEAAAITARNARLARTASGVRKGLRMDPEGPQPIAEVIRTGERKVLTHMKDSTLRELALNPEHLAELRSLRPRSVLMVPLKVRGETIGALTLGSLSDDNRYGPGEIAFAEDLARRAAAGIANARLHQRQTHLAQTLQRSLLPPVLPEIEGLEIAVRFRPAGVGSEVGGDFYDLFQLGERSWAAVIGDVCGKGPEAAALTSLTRDTLRASALRREKPSDALKLLNAAILETRSDGRFCTSAYARLDLHPRGVGLTVSNGGHPAPLVLRADGSVQPLAAPGTLLGIYPDPDLTDTSGQLSSGDAVVLYTDGLLDSRPAGSMTLEMLEGILSAQAGNSASVVAAGLESGATVAQANGAQDDIAILVLRCLR
jgi:serine phosphatase RsbU (regulator of sigma subunit)